MDGHEPLELVLDFLTGGDLERRATAQHRHLARAKRLGVAAEFLQLVRGRGDLVLVDRLVQPRDGGNRLRAVQQALLALGVDQFATERAGQRKEGLLVQVRVVPVHTLGRRLLGVLQQLVHRPVLGRLARRALRSQQVLVVEHHGHAGMALEGQRVQLAVALHRPDGTRVVLAEVELLLGNQVVERDDRLHGSEVVDRSVAEGRPHRIANAATGKQDGDLLDVVLASEAFVLHLDVRVLLHEERHLLFVQDHFLVGWRATTGMEGDLDVLGSLGRFRGLRRCGRSRSCGRGRRCGCCLGGFGLRRGRRRGGFATACGQDQRRSSRAKQAERRQPATTCRA